MGLEGKNFWVFLSCKQSYKTLPRLKIHKDSKLNSVLNSRKTYLIILFLLIIYLFQDDRILNEPLAFLTIRYVLASLIVLIFCYSRFIKFKRYYEKKMKDTVFIVSAILIIILSIIFCQAILSIPSNFFIKLYAKNSETEYYKCKIQNVVTTKVDKVHFIFLNRTYSRYLNIKDYFRKDLIDNYWLVIGVKKSIANSFCLESMQLEEK